jgi:hypothetical protein
MAAVDLMLQQRMSSLLAMYNGAYVIASHANMSPMSGLTNQVSGLMEAH